MSSSTLLERQLEASVREAQARKRSDIDEWLDAAPVPPKRLRRKAKMSDGESAIIVHRDVTPLDFTPEQRQMIRDTYANGADEREFQVLLEVARLRRLNPLLRQIHFVKRWTRDARDGKGGFVWSCQVSVDGLRAIAERTGKYDGQDEPEFGPMVNGFPEWAKVKVYRKDWARPAVGVAYWSEYVQRTKEGAPTRFWKEMPRVMLAKCAEGIAMRKAFPEDMGGLYTEEEMQQANNGAPPQISMHPHPGTGETMADPPKESDEYNDVMGTLGVADRAAFDPVCTWETMTHWREIIGSKGQPSELAKRLSALYHGDSISPQQRSDMGKLWNRVDRKLTQLESKLKPPPVEASFADADDDTDVFAPEREPGEDG